MRFFYLKKKLHAVKLSEATIQDGFMKDYMKILSAFLAVFFMTSMTYAMENTMRFRSGTILAAEISSKRPDIVIPNKYDSLPSYSSPMYAVLYVKFDEGRAFSLYDYILSVSGKPYRCVAVAENSGTFNTDAWDLQKTDPSKIYRLLFVTESLPGQQIEYTLKFRLFQTQDSSMTVKFLNLENNRFSYFSEIPSSGILGISLGELLKKRPQ